MLLNMLAIISFIGASLYLITVSIKQSHRKGLQKYKNSDDPNKTVLVQKYALRRGILLAGSVITIVAIAIIIYLSIKL